MNKILKVHPSDNVIVALTDLKKGELLNYDGIEYIPAEDIEIKHKFCEADLKKGENIFMYGVLVGKAQVFLKKGSLLTTSNVKHATNPVEVRASDFAWTAPDVSEYKNKTFQGYHREDGSVGTANYWLVIPLVFCENQNVNTLKETLNKALGYEEVSAYAEHVDFIINNLDNKSENEILDITFGTVKKEKKKSNIFPNVDGIKFLTHQSGCGGTRQDAQALCGLLAGYITNPNVAGATILSLGCQNAEESMLTNEIEKRIPNSKKPVYILNHQTLGTGKNVIEKALKLTLIGLKKANEITRQPAPLSKLCVGLECGGSDGFSGISANPTLGYFSDMLSALKGSVILSEFPELCGVEQELADRCVDTETAEKFVNLMKVYSQRAVEAGSGFDMNPSPGNIRDGLITDAIKSAGAAKKGGSSPINSVLDYPEKATKEGLTLLCTPGNDVESTTAEVASGANVVLFTTGLGTPTGNPIAPVVKVSSNTTLFNKMSDIMDFNCGSIIEGSETIPAAAARMLDYVIKVASGEETVKAVLNNQDDFIPWKRGVSL